MPRRTGSRFDNANSTSSNSRGSPITRRMSRSAGDRDISGRYACGRLGAVDPVAQFLASLEERHSLFVHRHRFAGAGIAPRARVAPLHGEGAEATQFHAFAARQGAGDLVEHGRDNKLHIGTAKMRIAGGEFRNEFRFGHEPRSSLTIQPPERCQSAQAPSRITPWENRLFQSDWTIQPRVEDSNLLVKPPVVRSSIGRSAETPLFFASHSRASGSPPIASTRPS